MVKHVTYVPLTFFNFAFSLVFFHTVAPIVFPDFMQFPDNSIIPWLLPDFQFFPDEWPPRFTKFQGTTLRKTV